MQVGGRVDGGRRIVALHRKLKVSPGCDLFRIPGKPPCMRWTTYERLVAELQRELYRHDGFFEQWIAQRDAVLSRLT